MTDTTPDATPLRCEVCGQRVSVYSRGERTNYYVGEAEKENERLRRGIQEAINLVGGPAMDYEPAVANKERMKKIDRAVGVLIQALERK